MRFWRLVNNHGHAMRNGIISRALGACPGLAGPLFFEDLHRPWAAWIMTSRKVVEPPSISKIISSLTSLSRGKMDVIGANLAEARQACLDDYCRVLKLTENESEQRFIQRQITRYSA